MKTATHIALIYAIVSASATAVNIFTQVGAMKIYSGASAVELSMLTGIAVGFPIKYLLEKKYVFDFKTNSLSHDKRLFIIYAFMGVITTAVFVGIEFTFHHLFGTDAMRYLGGVIGLTLGSYIKYHLDKNFVFKQEQL